MPAATRSLGVVDDVDGVRPIPESRLSVLFFDGFGVVVGGGIAAAASSDTASSIGTSAASALANSVGRSRPSSCATSSHLFRSLLLHVLFSGLFSESHVTNSSFLPCQLPISTSRFSPLFGSTSRFFSAFLNVDSSPISTCVFISLVSFTHSPSPPAGASVLLHAVFFPIALSGPPL